MKRRQLGHPLIISDWLKNRPYSQFTSYDRYYLNLANRVFDYLNTRGGWFREVFDRALLKEAAVMVVSQFEDFINEMGIWTAFIRKQEELYGWFLPFYDLENYDPEYINPEDYAFLFWHLGLNQEMTVNPYAPAIIEAGKFCFDLFEECIEEAPLSRLYDEWTTIGPEIPFFELKTRLHWMALDNYLFGLEFRAKLVKSVEGFSEEQLEHFAQDPGKLVYLAKDDYLYAKRTSLCGLCAPEWLAEVARCPDELRPAIRKLSQRVIGFFLYEGFDDRFYHFRFISSNRLFLIHRDSIDLQVSNMKEGEEAAMFSCVDWLGDWWLTGTYMGYPVQPGMLDQIRHNPKNESFYARSEDQQKKLREMEAEMEEAYLQFFGERLVLFPSEKAMQDGLQAYSDWWNRNKAKKPDKRTLSKYQKIVEDYNKGFDSPTKKWGPGPCTAFYEPGEGAVMSKEVPKWMEQMQKEQLTKEESVDLFYDIFLNCSPALARELVRRFSAKNLRMPLMSDDPDFVPRHFEFFLRYFSPEEFGEKKPMISFLPE